MFGMSFVSAHPDPRARLAPAPTFVTNDDVADAFERVANLLEARAHSDETQTYRVRAYRRAAAFVREHEADLLAIGRREDERRLEALPTIGAGLAGAIIEMATTGRFRLLERLEGETHPVELFAALPGVGRALAERIVQNLGITNLADLEQAAHDGHLAEVPGFGPQRIATLERYLAAVARRPQVRTTEERPPVGLLLEVDRRYRQLAREGRLHKIAPRRFNPRHEAWLPVMHHLQNGWSFDVMFSNTWRAHQLGHCDDWVVVRYRRENVEGTATVVTEHHGPDTGRRVVRGRERACRAHHEAHPPPRPKFEVPAFLLT